MRFLKILLQTALFIPGLGWSAHAQTKVEQNLSVEIDGVDYTTQHTWSLEDKKFRLDVASGGNITSYIFNGRVFYVCSALDKKQIDFLQRNDIKVPGLMKKFKQGVCQIVPSNFMARFFLSPTDAVESIDRTDAMRLTLSLDDYKLTRVMNADVQGECKASLRSYKITKATETGDEQYANVATEELCIAAHLDWRSGLWHEVSKTVLRQPGGAKFMNSLRQDNSKVIGLPIAAKIRVIREDTGGKKTVSQRQLTTQSVKPGKFPKKHFSIPAGFEIFSPEVVARELASAAQDNHSAKAKSKFKSDDDSFGLPSILLCAISGSFICLQ